MHHANRAPAGPTEPASTRPARVGWLDLSNGVSGDMILGALNRVLTDTDQHADVIANAVGALGLPVRLDVSMTSRAGLAAACVQVITNEWTGSEDATHQDGLPGSGAPGNAAPRDEHRRTWADIRRLLAGAPLSETVRERALATFAALAEAEAVVHGIHADEVHFHEVGALDALADVVGVCAGLDALGLDQLVASPVALGGGSARTEHGVLPIPGPAVLELLRANAMPGYGGPVDMELCTPTGAALVAVHADAYGPLPAMRVASVGVGAGQRDIPGRPNVVRLVVGTAPPADTPPRTGPLPAAPLPAAPMAAAPTADSATARIPAVTNALAVTDELLVETNVDDLDPRAWPEILATLLAAGASDAWLTPVLMKKGRPAHTLSVLVAMPLADSVRRAVFLHTPTLGLRETPVRKCALARAFRTVNVSGEPVAVKIGILPDGQIVTRQPEWDDVRRAAARLDRPARWVLATAAALASDTVRPNAARPDEGTDDDEAWAHMRS